MTVATMCVVCRKAGPDFIVVLGRKYCRACASDCAAFSARQRVLKQNVPSLADALLAEVQGALR